MKRVGHLWIYNNIASKVPQSEFSTEHAILPSCSSLLEWYSVDCAASLPYRNLIGAHIVSFHLCFPNGMMIFGKHHKLSAVCVVHIWLVDTRFGY